MLIRFICSNFLSFKDNFDFKLGTTDNKTKDDLGSHIYRYNKNYLKILKGNIIYGANASGKSNLLKAIEYSKDFILYGKQYLQTEQNKFTDSTETKFEYFFIIDNKMYNYGFILDSKNLDINISEEWLIEKSLKVNLINQQETVIFEREHQNFTYGNLKNILQQESKGEDFIKFSEQACSEKELFLKKLNDNNVKFISKIIDWFKKIIVVHNSEGINKTKQINLYISLNLVKQDIIDFIKENIINFDNRIDNIELTKVEINIEEINSIIEQDFNSNNNKNILEQRKKVIINMKDDINNIAIFNDDKRVFFIQKKDDIFYKRDFVIIRKNKQFTLLEESDGVNKIIELLILLYSIKENNLILCIDELETNLHSLLLQYFIKLFYKINKDNMTQLIAITHNTLLIDKELFKKSEIRFIEKDNNLNSIIRALNQYKVRDDLDYMKAYLNNRFGALPDSNEI